MGNVMRSNSIRPAVVLALICAALLTSPKASLAAGQCDNVCVVLCINPAASCAYLNCGPPSGCSYNPFKCDLQYPNHVTCGDPE